MAKEKEVTRVAVVPGVVTSYATAVRAHLSAALAYMRVGRVDLMDGAFFNLRSDLKLLEKEAYEIVQREEE